MRVSLARGTSPYVLCVGGTLIQNLSTLVNTMAWSRKQMIVKEVSHFGSMEEVRIDSYVVPTLITRFCLLYHQTLMQRYQMPMSSVACANAVQHSQILMGNTDNISA